MDDYGYASSLIDIYKNKIVSKRGGRTGEKTKRSNLPHASLLLVNW